MILKADNEGSNQIITKKRIFKYIENSTTKNWKFSDKNSDIFHISAQNIDCGYSLEPPHWGGSNEYPLSMVLSRNKKNNVYPCKSQFYYIKVGFRGSKFCFRDVVQMHSHSLIRIFTGAFWIAKHAMFLHADNEYWSDCANAQADLSLRRACISEGMFYRVEAFIILMIIHAILPHGTIRR